MVGTENRCGAGALKEHTTNTNGGITVRPRPATHPHAPGGAQPGAGIGRARTQSKRRREPPAIDRRLRESSGCVENKTGAVAPQQYTFSGLRLVQPVVCASSVERPVPRAGNLSYLSIPGPR